MIKKILIFTSFCLIAFPAWPQDICPSSQMLRFADGNTGCMQDYKFFNLPFPSERGASLKEVVSGKERMSIAMVINPKACPLNWMEFRVAPLKTWSDHTTSNTLARCEDRVVAAVLKQNKNPIGCDCEIIYNLEASTNVPFSKNVFEKKIRGWVAQAQNQDRFKGQFSEDEKKENTLFLAQYLESIDSASSNTLVAQNDAVKTNKLAEEKKALQDLAKKEEALKAQKLADEKKLQQELAKQQQLDLEQKQLAEKVRLEQDAVKKAQLEKDQKDLAEKTRQEKERIATETTRIQVELAKLKAMEKDKLSTISSQTTKSVKALVIGNSSYGVSALTNPIKMPNSFKYLRIEIYC